MSSRDEVLVAIVNTQSDFAIARDEHWYRIPISNQSKWIGDRWPPKWLAFYQTKVVGQDGHTVRYYARVSSIEVSTRRQLFPNETPNAKRSKEYYKLNIEPLRELSAPIRSRRFRKIVFISTTWKKFMAAGEINDLFDESPLEDHLWQVLKRERIPAERQEFVEIESEHFSLDFAIYCAHGKIDVEADGDQWHANRERAAPDNRRNNALEANGWKVLRFSTQQIEKDLEEDCLPKIIKTINQLGGIDEGGDIPRRIEPPSHDGYRQRGLFDES